MSGQVMPVLGLLLLFQYTVLLGPPPFIRLPVGPGWLLLLLEGRLSPHDSLSEETQVRNYPSSPCATRSQHSVGRLKDADILPRPVCKRLLA